MARAIDHCISEGHDIVSLVVKEAVEPTTKVVFRSYLTLCRKCGNSPDTITKIRTTRHPGNPELPKQNKEKANGRPKPEPGVRTDSDMPKLQKPHPTGGRADEKAGDA